MSAHHGLEDIWLTGDQAERLDELIDSIGPGEVVRRVEGWSGGGPMDDVVPYLTQSEASALILVLSLVAST